MLFSCVFLRPQFFRTFECRTLFLTRSQIYYYGFVSSYGANMTSAIILSIHQIQEDCKSGLCCLWKTFFFFFQIDLMIKKRRCSFSPKRSFVWLQLLAFVGHHDFSITLTEVSVFCTGTASPEQKCGYITSYKINKTRQQKKTKNNTIMIFSTLSYA